MTAPIGYRAKWSATREDIDMQIKCMKIGYKVYPKTSKYAKHWPLVRLAYSFRGKEHISKEEPFAQVYYSYAMHQLYYKLFDNYIRTTVKKVRVVKPVGIKPLPPPMKKAGPPPPNKSIAPLPPKPMAPMPPPK